ncbi:putative Heat shock 70 kDa protein 6 [Hypsibius exemplaris]|uniref:Heat shock 70 kDa protein 6 n=1 Tax=Hypsibius exemplaris TaxID=2072580 RepID=A0A1W0WZY4_HYPEX|nr:putative Heat shock 70 kDa protein 6 [Hypsibius exemplaris]
MAFKASILDYKELFCCLQNRKAFPIVDDVGSITTPCYVAFENGGFIVGNEAKENAQWKPNNTVLELANHRSTLSYDGEVNIFTPEDIIAEILKVLKAVAENFSDIPVKRVVLTVPAYFADRQREATLLAGQKAGLEVLGVINEPIAAGKSLWRPEASRNAAASFWCLTLEIGLWTSLSYLPRRSLGVRREAEHGNRTLSHAQRSNFAIQSLHNKKPLNTVLTREQFEEVCSDLYPKVLPPVEAALRSAQLNRHQISQVLMVGGSSKMPKIQEMLADLFGPKQIRRDFMDDGVIARGAAIFASSTTDPEMESSSILKTAICDNYNGTAIKEGPYSVQTSEVIRDEFVIGIDLGLHKSCAAVYQNESVRVIPHHSSGSTTSPNYVAYEEGTFIAGEEAQNSAPSNPKNTFFEVRNIIGRRYDTDVVAANKARWPFDVVDKKGFPALRLRYDGTDYVFSPEEVTAEIMKDIKRNAEGFLGAAVTKAVVTVPVNFVAAQRQATKLAGRLGGLDIIAIVNEAAAAAMAYSAQCHAPKNGFIVVVNFRRLSLTITLLKVLSEFDFQVEASVEDHQIGSDKFRQKVAQKILLEFEQTHGPGLAQNSAAIARLRGEVKEVTCNELCIDVRENINDVLRAANLEPTAIDDVILVGGGCKMPMIQSMLEKFFSPEKIRRDINMDEVIAKGAAAFGRYISKLPFPVPTAHNVFYSRGGNISAPVYFSYSTPTTEGVFRFELDIDSLYSNVHVIPIIPLGVSFRRKGQKLALKTLQVKPLTGIQESTLLSLRHPNVVEYLLCGEISTLNLSMVGILMEYCPGGSLNSLVTETVLTEWEICWFLRQVVKGLVYLHGIIAHAHGDIRGSKVLLTADRLNCKIGDSWNFYSLGEREAAHVNPSSLLHMSPELLFSTFSRLDQTNVFAGFQRAFRTPVAVEKKAKVEPADDIWSLGCLTLEMFNKGQVPYVTFKGKPLQLNLKNNSSRDPPAGLQLLRHVKKKALPDLFSADSQRMSATLKVIVKRCLSKSADRPVATELAVDLENLMNRANSPPHAAPPDLFNY